MFVYLGLLISTSHYWYLWGSWLCRDDKTDNFRTTHPCSEKKAVCLYCSQEIQAWRLTHEHGQSPFWEALRTGIVSCGLELSTVRAFKRVHLRGRANAQTEPCEMPHVTCEAWRFLATLPTMLHLLYGTAPLLQNTRPAAVIKRKNYEIQAGTI